MNLYQAKVQGTFEMTQQVRANSLEEALQKLANNEGNNVDETALSTLDVRDVIEVA